MEVSKKTTFTQNEHGVVLCAQCRDEHLNWMLRREIDDLDAWSSVNDPDAVCVACSYSDKHWGSNS